VSWTPPERTNLLFANASFQWLPDHQAVLRRMLQALPGGGVLAVQMPDNMSEPALALMSKVAGRGPWAGNPALAAAAREPLSRPEAYYDLLKPLCAQLDIWHTIYNHVMAGPQAIVEWFKVSALRPYLDALDPAMRDEYLAAYLEEIKQHYRARHDGRVLLPFPRVFIVAVR
jgi:trans-aconitate 2-methyltransferase